MAKMANRERTGNNISEKDWQVLPGGTRVKIIHQDADSSQAAVIFPTPEADSPEDFETIVQFVVNEAKPKGTLKRLADDIRNLERPEMRKKAIGNIKRRIKRAMDRNPAKFPPKSPKK